ncbi:MAG: PD-(D/E)XK nuclease family protein, partial [Acidobacteria bacterium]|nr:PD-(D/E)XK nuclease family protein [Acidobacteriota bacterium]
MTQELEPRAAIDRGAERLLRQTRFLAATFRAYERRRAAAGGLDEHALRDLLLLSDDPGAYRYVVVTVGDRASDETGLFAADFDLLTRVAGLETLDVVATEESLAAGLAERLLELLPGIEEVIWSGGPPAAGPAVRAFFTSRDREEELADVARRLRAARRDRDEPASLERTAVVFRRPLPYVYLAQVVLDAAGIPYQAADALPLAAEPFAAALDLVFSFVTSAFRRAEVTALLACPHFVFDWDGEPVGREAVPALDRALADAGYLGGMEELPAVAATLAGPLVRAALAAARAAEELALLATAAPASDHLGTLLVFLKRHERRTFPDDVVWERHQRARAAIMAALEELRAAHQRHHDPIGPFADVAATIRRWIEEQTFSPRRGGGGVHLVDAHAARYSDCDDAFLVGLVDIDWPGGLSRNIFYPSALLSPLGWPPERARRAGTRAAFADLLRLARRHVTVSAFTLEDDALVAPSALLEDVELPGAPSRETGRETPARIFADEALTADPVRADVLQARARPWLALRQARSPASDPRYHGRTGPGQITSFSVSAVDVYIECPFRFFATYVLKLEEEPEDEEGVTPRERGKFVHEVLRTFYAGWQARGGREIIPDNIDEARRLFAEVAAGALDRLPATVAAAERPGLLGSPVTPGAGEIVLVSEATRPFPVAERLFEHAFEGTYELTGRQGARRLRLRGTVDRIDLLADGRFRIVDYKTGRAFDWRRSTQLPI